MRPNLFPLLLVFCLLACDAEQVDPDTDKPKIPRSEQQIDLATVLTSGQWVKVLGAGPHSEFHIYDFHLNGTYNHRLESDFVLRDSGTWKLLNDRDHGHRLTITKGNETPGANWLNHTSSIEYDIATDQLVLTGEYYAGRQMLKHRRHE